MANNVRKNRINTEDIAGKVFGVYKVNKYVGTKSVGVRKPYLQHQYEIECTVCGSKRVSSRETIMRKEAIQRSMCIICNGRLQASRMSATEEKHAKSMDACRVKKNAYRTNTSTGIKRYSITFMPTRCKGKGEYSHIIDLYVDCRHYVLARQYNKSGELLPEFVDLANELNEAMSHGKEYFYWWYENVFKKNSK